MDATDNTYIGSAHACARLGIDKSTLIRWVQNGRIKPAVKAPGSNGAYLFTPAEVALAAERRKTRT